MPAGTHHVLEETRARAMMLLVCGKFGWPGEVGRRLHHGGYNTTVTPRRLQHGGCITAGTPRRSHHGGCTTAVAQRRSHHGGHTKAATPRRLHHGGKTMAVTACHDLRLTGSTQAIIHRP
eukprot:360199-Chlamydomonas_euryale.AAC.1